MRSLRPFNLLLLTVALAGCATPRVPPEVGRPYDPVLGILYHPFAEPGMPQVARPKPDRSGWTQGRMELDLRRLRRARVKVVFVVLEAGSVKLFQLERLHAFTRLAGDNPDAPRVALWLQVRDSASPALRHLISQVVRTGAPKSRGWYRLDNRPLLVLEDVGRAMPRHPAFTFRRAGGDAGNWAAPTGPQSAPRFGANGRQALVSGGYWDAGRDEWVVPRNHGRTLRDQLWQAALRRPDIIVVSSWDAFHRGDFLVPNTLDGENAYERLVEEGQWLEGLARTVSTASRGGN